MDDVLGALRQLSNKHAVVCFNDVLLFLPREKLAAIRPYLHQGGFNLLSYVDKARGYDTLLEQTNGKETELLKLATIAKERELSLAQSNAEADRLRADAARLTADLKAKEVELLAAHAERKHLAAISSQREQALMESKLEGDRLRDQAATLQTDLVAKEAVIGDLSHICDERLQLINELAYTGQRPIVDTTKVATHRIQSLLSRTRRALRLRFQAWLEKQTPYQIGKLVQYASRPMQPEKFPSGRPPARWPRICIITPSYNQGDFLSRTMDSVLNQNYPNLTYGVQDGGSTDDSPRIITEHIARLTHAESAKDEGQADAIQKGFKKLYPERNDIMAWLNSDDMLMPGALEYVGRYFARHPEVDVIYGHRVIIDENDEEVGRWFMPRYHANTLPWFDLVPQETLFWRGRCYEQIGGMDPSYHFAMDWDLLLRFEQAGFHIRRLPYFLGCFRLHSAKIHTMGEQEMQRLRHRVHEREVPLWEIHQHLTDEINRSALVEWLHRHCGIRF
jgi:GT2 family glycosyltransferase